MAKEEKSSFQLKKGADHNFDIKKGSKRVFDLTKDHEEQVITTPTPQPNDTNGGAGTTGQTIDSKRNNWWLWVALAIIVALLIWWLWPTSSNGSEMTAVESTEESIESTDDTNDTVVTGSTTPEVQTESSVSDEAESSPVAEGNSNVGNPAEEKTTAAPTGSPSLPDKTPATQENENNSIEMEALKVIHGDYGVGLIRKKRLGSRYQAIQNRVNELKREGLF